METTTKLRMIGDVLMESRSKIPPPKRRIRKAKKTTKPIIRGTIQKYFLNLHVRKECNTILAEGAEFPVEMRKRKAMDVLEQDASCTSPAKSRRIDDGKNVLTGPGIKTILYLGAKSISERETTVGQRRDDTNWINLGGLRERGKCSLPGDFRLMDKIV